MSGPHGWMREKDKAFKNVLVLVDLMEGEAVWNKIDDIVGRGTAKVGKLHSELLVEDVGAIEVGWVPMPVYTDNGSIEGGFGGKKDSGRTRGGHEQKGSSKSIEQDQWKGSTLY